MWLIPCEMEPPVINLGQVWTKIILKMENVRAWKPFWRVLDHENDSARGLPYQDTVHQALNICLFQSFGLMNLVRTHSVAVVSERRRVQQCVSRVSFRSSLHLRLLFPPDPHRPTPPAVLLPGLECPDLHHLPPAAVHDLQVAHDPGQIRWAFRLVRVLV